MPYSGKDDPNLPDAVKKMSAKKRSQWVAVFNGALERCQQEDGKDCEEKAFKMAYGVVGKKEAHSEGGLMNKRPKREIETLMNGEESIEDMVAKVHSAFHQEFGSGLEFEAWVSEVYETHAVVRYKDKNYDVPFELKDDEVVFAPFEEWKQVELESQWVPLTERLAFFQVAEAKKKEGKQWLVTIIGPDTKDDIIEADGETYIRSANGRLYSASALEEAAPLFERVKVYDNHLTDEEFAEKQGMRSVANELVGVIVDVAWDEKKKAIVGTLKVIDEGLRTKLLNAAESDVLSEIGLSIDAVGEGEEKEIDGQSYLAVHKITDALSVDVVAEPAAGGRFLRLVAAKISENKEKSAMEMQELLEKIGSTLDEKLQPIMERVEALEAAVAEEPETEETEEDVQEGEQPDPETEHEEEGLKKEDVEELVKEAKKAADEVKRMAEAARVEACTAELDTKLKASGLPSYVQKLIRKQFAGRVFESKELEEIIKEMRAEIAEGADDGIVVPDGVNLGTQARVSRDEWEMSLMRLVAGSSRFADLVAKAKENAGKPQAEIDHYAPQRFSESFKRYAEKSFHVPEFGRLSEWYVGLMGGYDYALDGKISPERLSEANITTSTVSSIVKNTVNLLLAADYSVREAWWDPIVRQEDVATLDDATLVRVFGIGGLNAMSQGDTYLELDWEDEEETSSYFKRGGYIGVTLETLLRDKLAKIRSLPSRLANAWYNEVSDLVANVFTVNSSAGPVLADTGALFNATAVTSAGGHANLLTTGLGYSGVIAARTAMRKQTDQPLGAGRRLNITPRYLLVPVDLEATAKQIVMSEMVPSQSGGATSGGELQTRNILQGALETIVVPAWTDANDWALVADPAQFPAIYLIWLRGRRTPELFSAEDERAGSMFTNDELRFKVRLFGFRFSSTYHCAPVADFRPLHKNNVS